MEEDRALAVAVELGNRGVNCRLERDAGSRYQVRVALQHDRAALWDLHGDLLEAWVLRAETLVGFVSLPVPTDLSDQALAGLVATQRYEQLTASSHSRSFADPGQRRRSRDHGAGRRRLWPVFWLLLGMLAVILALYLIAGRTRPTTGESGTTRLRRPATWAVCDGEVVVNGEAIEILRT